jgi:hypothetical protein
MQKLFITVVVVAALAIGADAWWCPGHMITAEIARQNLETGVEAKVNAYFADLNKWGPFAQTSDMIDGSCWADDLKAQHLRAMAHWHFIDIAYIKDGFQPAPGLTELQKDNVANQIEKLGETISSRSYANNWEKAFAVANLVHFYGDVHQPLHAATMFSSEFPTGDHGGNLFKVNFPAQPTITELHAVWDSVCGQYAVTPARPLNATSRAFIQGAATKIAAANPSTPAMKKVWNATVMADEGHADAVKYAYASLTSGATLTPEYIEQCGKIADLRLALGGYRLASELNYAFGGNYKEGHNPNWSAKAALRRMSEHRKLNVKHD